MKRNDHRISRNIEDKIIDSLTVAQRNDLILDGKSVNARLAIRGIEMAQLTLNNYLIKMARKGKIVRQGKIPGPFYYSLAKDYAGESK